MICRLTIVRKSLRSALVALAVGFSVSAALACELCNKTYFDAMEAAPKASALYPNAKVTEYSLTVSKKTLSLKGKEAEGLVINGGTPGPVLRFKEGEVARITVINGLDDDSTSMHWHGVLVPNLEDGVPVVSTPMIGPGKSRVFEFLVRQNGTYWYHSHTGHQEQRGVYGSIVIEPKGSGLKVDRDEVIILGEWTDEHPSEIQRTLLRGSDWYSVRKGTKQSILGAYQAGKLGEYFANEKKLVPPMDLSDVAYDAFLMNGEPGLRLPAKSGETVRLRVINAGAASYFYLDGSEGPLKIISADGQDVVPLTQQRLLIGPAETYDLLFTVPAAGASEFRATAQDGSGSVSAIIGDGEARRATSPPMPERYGMDEYLTSILDQLDPEPGASVFPRPLSPYAKLRMAKPHAVATAHRDITLKLMGDMVRYEWTFDGLAPDEAEAIKVKANETLRIKLVNNTMMHHPIHLHGHFFRVVEPDDKDPATSLLKHTIDIPPMSTRTIEFTANEGEGDWLLHCHLLYHHITGMVRTVRVTGADGSEPPHVAATHSMDSTYAWGQVAVTHSNYNGFATVQSGKNNLFVRWQDGFKEADGHEGEISYERYLNTRLSAFLGYRFSSLEGGRDGPFAGIAYRLPYFIDLRLSQQSSGETRASLAKNLQLTERINLELSVQHGRKTGTDYSANVNYLLSKNFSLTAGYTSEFGVGVGVITRF